jgi:D-arabinitol 2-dehydrogenase
MASIFKPTAARQALRAAVRPALAINTRSLSTTPARLNDDDPKKRLTTEAPQGASGTHEGAFARTDDNLVIEHPTDAEMPRSPVVQGRGGMHFKRTLASFSLENKVSIVTGGARGLGLVMGQALIASGSDLAIVDLNSMCFFFWARN